MEEPGQRRAVPGLGGAMALDLGRVLGRLGKDGGIAVAKDLRSGRLQRLEDGRPGALVTGDDGLAGERGEMRLEVRPLVDPDSVAEMLADVVAQFLRGDEQIGGSVVMDEREGESDRRMVDVFAPYVEGPGDRIERRE